MHNIAPASPGRLQLLPPRQGEKAGTLVLVDGVSGAPILQVEITPEVLGLVLLGKGSADPNRPTSAKVNYSLKNLERIGRRRETKTEILRVGLRAFNEAETELAEAQASIDISEGWQVVDNRELVARANQVRCDEQFSWQRVTVWRLRELTPQHMTRDQSLVWLSEIRKYGDQEGGVLVRDFPPSLMFMLRTFLDKRPDYTGEEGDIFLTQQDLADFVAYLPRQWREIHDANY